MIVTRWRVKLLMRNGSFIEQTQDTTTPLNSMQQRLSKGMWPWMPKVDWFTFSDESGIRTVVRMDEVVMVMFDKVSA